MPDLSDQSYVAPPSHPAVQAISQPAANGSTQVNGNAQGNGNARILREDPHGTTVIKVDKVDTHPRDHAKEPSTSDKPLPPQPPQKPTETTDQPSTVPTQPSSQSNEPTVIDTTQPPPYSAAAEGVQSSRPDDAFPPENPRARKVLNGKV
ncbi:hypothetical protein GLOTRDRAFT_134171, partial [Gloeophyllum trabeum ATCC 11539]